MPDFEGSGEDLGGEDLEGDGEEMEGGDFGGDEEEEEFVEDRDVTSPESSKYTATVKQNLRDMPAHKPTTKTDDKLADLGPDLKADDGSGTKPPVARKGAK